MRGRGVFRSVKDLEAAIREYIDVHNEDPKPFVWTKTADNILDSIARYALRERCPTLLTYDTNHWDGRLAGYRQTRFSQANAGPSS